MAFASENCQFRSTRLPIVIRHCSVFRCYASSSIFSLSLPSKFDCRVDWNPSPSSSSSSSGSSSSSRPMHFSGRLHTMDCNFEWCHQCELLCPLRFNQHNSVASVKGSNGPTRIDAHRQRSVTLRPILEHLPFPEESRRMLQHPATDPQPSVGLQSIFNPGIR